MAESAQSTEAETGTNDINNTTSIQTVSGNLSASGQVPTLRTPFELGRVYDIDCGTPNAAATAAAATAVAKGPVLSSSRSNSEDEDEQTPNGDAEGTDNSGRPKSPPPNCAICLGRCKNKCFTDSCMHQFCFKCLCEWSKVKPECPLCKQSFEKIIHNVKSDNQFEEYHIQQQIPMPIPNRTFQLSYRNLSHIFPDEYPVPIWENPQILSRHGRTYFYRAMRTSTFNRSEPGAPMYDDSGNRIVNDRFYQRELYSLFQQENPPNTPIDMHRLRIIWRRLIYEKNIYALPVPDITGGFRESSARYYRENTLQVRRVITFIGREFRALLRDAPETDITALKGVVRHNLPLINILSPAFRRLVATHIGEKAPHFIHEVYNFARSPFDMIGYDEVVQYTEVSSEEIVETTTSTDSGNATNSSSARRQRRQVPIGIRGVNVPPTTGLNLLGDYDALTRAAGQQNNSGVINLDISTMSDGSEISGISPGSQMSAVNLSTRNRLSEPVIIDSDDTDDESYIHSSTSSGSSNVEEVPNPSYVSNQQRLAANASTEANPNSTSTTETTTRQESEQNAENHTNDGISEMVLQLLLEDIQPNNSEEDQAATSAQSLQNQNNPNAEPSTLPLTTPNNDPVPTDVNLNENQGLEDRSNQPDVDSGGGNLSLADYANSSHALVMPTFDDLNDLPDLSHFLPNIVNYTDSQTAGPSTSQSVSSIQNSNETHLSSNATTTAQTTASASDPSSSSAQSDPSASAAPSVSAASAAPSVSAAPSTSIENSDRELPSLSNSNVPSVDLTTASAVVVRIHPAFQSTADTLAMQMNQASRPMPVITANIVLNTSSSDECEFVLARGPPHLRTPEQMVSLSSSSDSDCVLVTETKPNLKNVPFATTDEEVNDSNKVVAANTSAIQKNFNIDPVPDDDNVPSTSRGLRSRNKKKTALDNVIVEESKATKRRRSTRRKIISKRLINTDFSKCNDSTDSENDVQQETLKNKPKRPKPSSRKNQRNSSESSRKSRRLSGSKRKKSDSKAADDEENKKNQRKSSTFVNCEEKSSSSSSSSSSVSDQTDDEDGLSLHNLQKRLKYQKGSEKQENFEDKPDSPEQNLESSVNEETESSNDNMRLNIQNDEPGKSSVFTLVTGRKRNDEKPTPSFFDLKNIKHRFKVDKATDAQNDLVRSDFDFNPNGGTIPKPALRQIANLPFTNMSNPEELSNDSETNTTKMSTQLFKASPASRVSEEESENSRDSTELQNGTEEVNFDQEDSCSNISENSQDTKKSHNSEHSKHSQSTKDCPDSPTDEAPSENSQDSDVSQNSSVSHLTKSTHASHQADESSRSSIDTIDTIRTNISNESNHSEKSRHSSFSNIESHEATKSNYSSDSSIDSENGNDNEEELVPDLNEKEITMDNEKTICEINDYDIPSCSNSQVKYTTDIEVVNLNNNEESKQSDLIAIGIEPDDSDTSDASCYIKPRRRKPNGEINKNNNMVTAVASVLDKEAEQQKIRDSLAERLRNETRPIRIQPRKCPRDRYPFGSVVIERRYVKRKSSSKRHRSESSRSRTENPTDEPIGPCSGTACRIVNNQHIPLIDPVTNDDSNSSTTKTLSYVTVMQAKLAEDDQRAAAEQARKREAAAKIYGIRNISEDSNDAFFFES